MPQGDDAARRAFDDAVVDLGSPPASSDASPPLTSAPLLAALGRAGTRHIYGATADTTELGALLTTSSGAILREVDGNTVDQPLVHKVLRRYLGGDAPAGWARRLRELQPDLSRDERNAVVYAIACGRAGNDAARAFGAGRTWDVSLQLHMSLGAAADAATRVGRCLRRMVPSGVVNVPFTPHYPHCFLIARDLEREGIPVNFTSTSSVRQTVAAALLADVTLTTIFMGRLNQGLHAALLGEHAALEAQRTLRRLRRDAGVKTLLIVTSMREWQTFVRLAGCDAFTAPLGAISGFLTQAEVAPVAVRSQLETSYADRLGIATTVVQALGAPRIARLYDVEPDLVRFLTEYRTTAEYQALRDGEALFRRFDEAGFGDLFYAPTASEWQELRQNKLPKLGAPLTARLPLDTLYTLLADADFEKVQEEVDVLIDERVGG